MYYTKSKMKNTIFKLLKYSYYFSLIILFVIYLFPGSLIGYLLYDNLSKQPNLVPNPAGTSINHLIYFSWLTLLAVIVRIRIKNIFTNIYIIFFIAIFSEIAHLIVPNRAFEYSDLLANILGVLLIVIVRKSIRWLNFF